MAVIATIEFHFDARNTYPFADLALGDSFNVHIYPATPETHYLRREAEERVRQTFRGYRSRKDKTFSATTEWLSDETLSVTRTA